MQTRTISFISDRQQVTLSAGNVLYIRTSGRVCEIHAAAPDHGVQIVGIALVPQCHRVVVGPHQIELHAVLVARAEEAVV